MRGSVRLNSKRAAFSISSAREGGARVSEVAATRDRDFRVEDERARIWEGVIVILGSGIWETESLGLVVVVEEEREGKAGIRGLEEAMIILAMAAADNVDDVQWDSFFWERVRV